MQLTASAKRALAWAALVGVGVFVLWLLSPVLAPFLVAAVLAYALSPVVDGLARLSAGRVPRLLLVLLVEVVLLLAMLGALFLIVPIFVKELPQLRAQAPLLLEALNRLVQPLFAQLGWSVSLDMATLKPLLLDYLGAMDPDWRSILASLKLGGSVALALLGNAVLMPVALFYLLLDWPHLVARLATFVPPRWHVAFHSFSNEVSLVLGQYLRGQLLVMLVLALYYSAGLALFGLDLAVPIGVFTGLAVFVPYVGFGLGLFLATLAGLLEFAPVAGPGKALLMVALVYGLGQLIESFLLTPRLVGERIGLHPLAVIFALLAFGQLLGFVGVLIALPASAVLLVALRRAQKVYLTSRLYSG